MTSLQVLSLILTMGQSEYVINSIASNGGGIHAQNLYE